MSGYAAQVKDMKSKLQADSQVNLGPVLRKEFDFSKLRADLNTVNTAFDEETQRGTDRLIRVILQDLSELEVANTQKEGIPRSDIRVAKMAAKLDKLESAFDDYLKFAGQNVGVGGYRVPADCAGKSSRVRGEAMSRVRTEGLDTYWIAMNGSLWGFPCQRGSAGNKSNSGLVVS